MKNLSDELSRVIRRRERTETEIRKYGAWADAKAITVELVQADLSNIGFEVSGINPSSGFDTAIWLNPEYLNLDACRRVIQKYDVRVKVLASGKLRISCIFVPKGEVVRLESMRDNITVQAVSINGVGGAS